MSASSIAHEARRTPQWFPDLPQLLERALDRYDASSSGDLDELRSSASEVKIGRMSVHGEFSVISDECWIAPGSISATLVFEEGASGRVELTDSFPIRVHYTVTDHRVAIKNIEVDLSSIDE